MAEKVIHEVRFIETDDGFRIEVKGDKERIKQMGFGPGMMGFRPRMRFRKRNEHGRFHHHHKHHFRHNCGPWGWHEDDDEAEPVEKPFQAA